MSVRPVAADQPESFAFTEPNLTWAKQQIEKYPQGRQASAVIPLLWRAQQQNGGWLPQAAIEYIAELLDMAPIRVMEVATFYTMFNLAPVGKYFIQLCGTTPCLLRGSDALVEVLKKRIGEQNQVSEDGLFSWLEVECLGACANAPMVQINNDYFEDLDAGKLQSLLDDLEAGRDVTPGPQNGRSCSCPEGGPTSLTDSSLYTGSDDREAPAVAAMNAESLANGEGHEVPRVAREDKAETVLATFDNEKEKAVEETGSDAPTDEFAPAASDNAKPIGLPEPREGGADDLKKISGVGPKLEETLNSLGIYHFDQIAGWNRDNVAWVDNFLSFKGRIDRENWIEQAGNLAKAVEIKTLTDDSRGDD